MFRETLYGLSFLLLSFISQAQAQPVKKYKPLSIEVGNRFLANESLDQRQETIRKLYENMQFEIKKLPSSNYPFIKAQWSPTNNWNFEAGLGFLVSEDITGSGRVNTICGSDTLFKSDIYLNTSFNESFVGFNIKYYLNTESGRLYVGLGAEKISEKVRIDAKVDVYDATDGKRLAFYDGTHNYSGESYQVNTLFGVEIPVLEGLNIDFFFNYTIEGKCTAKLASKIEIAQGLGATLSEEKVDEKKGTSYVGLGIKYDLPFEF